MKGRASGVSWFIAALLLSGAPVGCSRNSVEGAPGATKGPSSASAAGDESSGAAPSSEPAPSASASPPLPSGSPSVTISALMSDPDRYHGTRVELTGTVGPGATERRGSGFTMTSLRCTERRCVKDDCCNTCSGPAGLAVDGVPLRIRLIGSGYSCGGKSCEVECNPPRDSKVTVTGVLQTRREIAIRVESLKAVEDEK